MPSHVSNYHAAFLKSTILVIIAVFLLMGCAHRTAKAEPTDRVPSYAIPPDSNTSIARALAPRTAKFQGMSGFRLLETGQESFAMRLALIETAEQSIDLQYYAIHDDTTANLLLQALIRAANRGVRVRFLMDAITLDEVDTTFNILNGIDNLEVRVFNPLTTRKQDFISRMVTRVTNLSSMNRRMHNKALISDNQLAIMGGRNLGDEYFEKFTNSTFKDVDILAAGPITTQISDSFDEYWNNENTITLVNLIPPTETMDDIITIRESLAANWQTVYNTKDGKDLLDIHLADRLTNNEIPFYWSHATMNADDPDKINNDADEADITDSVPLLKLTDLLDKATEEFIIVSPYFVPTDDGVDWLIGMEERGMDVRVLTNSLSSTDVVAVHTGYNHQRRKLLEGGVELYEMKAIGGERPDQRLAGMSTPSQASLHSKVFVVDRHDAMVGSFNMDPRSVYLNTEAMLSIYSPDIAGQLVDMFYEAIAPENSYKLELGKYNRLHWTTVEDGEEVIYNMEPEAGIGRRLQVMFFDILPIEKHL